MQINLGAGSPAGLAARGGLLTAICMGGGLLVGVAAGSAVGEASPAVAALIAGLILAGAGAVWGRSMADIIGSAERRRMAIGGALTFGPGVIMVGLGITGLEGPILSQSASGEFPIHIAYRLVFPPAGLLVAALGGLALGLAQRAGARAAWMAVLAGLTAGLMFLVVVLVMDAIGYRVGAPGAEARATMVTVTLVGTLAGALTGGAALSWSLARAAAPVPSTSA